MLAPLSRRPFSCGDKMTPSSCTLRNPRRKGTESFYCLGLGLVPSSVPVTTSMGRQPYLNLMDCALGRDGFSSRVQLKWRNEGG